MQPSDGEAEKFSKEKLDPFIRDNDVVGAKMRDAAAGEGRKRGNTILAKLFDGGFLGIVGATSPKGLRSRNNRVILFDEVDGYPHSAGEEGDPIGLAKKRSLTYSPRKWVLGSTPTIKGRSRIERAFRNSDQRHYYVPCPHCAELQKLEWGGKDCKYGIKWTYKRDADDAIVLEGGEAAIEEVYYLCRANGCVIEETHKLSMLDAGAWVADNPGHRIRGYHISGLYSPFEGASWLTLVREFLAAKDKPDELKLWVNTVLGLPWEEDGAGVTADTLADRLEPFPSIDVDGEVLEYLVPMRAGVLTRSTDTQGDRLETAVWAWGAGEEAWLVDHEIIPGDPGIPFGGKNSPWNELARRLGKAYRHEGGAELVPSVTFVDSGGHHKGEVHAFTRKFQAHNVFSIYGATTQGAPMLGKATRNNDAKVIQYAVGSYTGKSALMSRLEKIREPGPGYIHLPDWLDGEQLGQFGNEKLVTRVVKGRSVAIWVQNGRNEMIDLYVYALGALRKLGPRIGRELADIVKRVQEEGRKAIARNVSAKPKLVRQRPRMLSRGIE